MFTCVQVCLAGDILTDNTLSSSEDLGSPVNLVAEIPSQRL